MFKLENQHVIQHCRGGKLQNEKENEPTSRRLIKEKGVQLCRPNSGASTEEETALGLTRFDRETKEEQIDSFKRRSGGELIWKKRGMFPSVLGLRIYLGRGGGGGGG